MTKEDIRDTGLYAPILDHVGDGNFHLGICAKDDDAAEFAKAEGLHSRLVSRAIDMGGACTGEHGVGRGRKIINFKNLPK